MSFVPKVLNPSDALAAACRGTLVGFDVMRLWGGGIARNQGEFVDQKHQMTCFSLGKIVKFGRSWFCESMCIATSTSK